MWLIPTRNRPQAMQELILAMELTGCVPEAAVMIDGSPDVYKDVRWPSNWHIHHDESHLEVVGAINSLYKLYPNEKTYGFITDHGRPISEDWATEMEQAAGGWNIALCDDFHNRINPGTGFRRITAASCYGGELVRALGWVWPDYFIHFFGDDVWEEIGHECDLIRYREDIKIRDLLASKGEFPVDENNKRLWRGKPYHEKDKLAFKGWMDELKDSTISMLRHRMSGTDPVTIACVKWGSAYGPEYVNNLASMVRRNLSGGFPGKIVCFTDDGAGIDDTIEILPLPEGLTGWWNKLYLFKEGIFSEGERVLYIDLDTIIVGGLDDIASYDGDFAILRDFYRPNGFGSGLMAWRGGFGKKIWESFEAAGCPDIPGGDQSWIERHIPIADLWQDILPGQAVSFKAHCRPHPPKGAKVVCFHGQPKPHNCNIEWVDDVWAGNKTLDYKTESNTSRDRVAANIVAACVRELEWLVAKPAQEGLAIIVGGGPSLTDFLPEIAARKQNGAVIFATNGSHDHLIANGIIPDYQTVIDARAENAVFLSNPREEVTYFLASQCAPESFDAVSGHKVVAFHLHLHDAAQIIPDCDNQLLVGGGSTVGLITINLAYGLGYSEFHLYGFDSSYLEENHHAYDQTMNDTDHAVEVESGGRKFQSAPWMVVQANEFIELSTQLANQNCTISVSGDGLLPWVAHQIQQQLKETI